MIFAIGGIKGGIGKTTLAVNLAVMLSRSGHDVLLVDADEQGSASHITDWRAETYPENIGYTLARLTGKTLARQIQSYAKRFDHIVIDTGGRDTTSQRSALVVANRYLVPFPPKSLDVDTMGQVEQLVSDAQAINPELEAFTVLNRAYPANRDNDDAAALLAESEDFTHLPMPVVDRKAFSDAITEGRAVVEYKPRNTKAEAEIVALFEGFTGLDFKGR